MGIAGLFGRRHVGEALGAPPVERSAQPTKALGRFLDSLASRAPERLLDLGPVVGTNVTFFGEELGCKILVDDLSADIDRHVREDRLDSLPAFLAQRFPQPSGSLDAIVSWNVFDYLPRPAVDALARQMVRLLRPGGLMLGFFATMQPQAGAHAMYTKHIVVDRSRIEHRPYPAAGGRQRPLLSRDIERIFEPLRVTEQFLLKTSMREVLFRKPPE